MNMHQTTEIVLASRNLKKSAEIAELLAPFCISVISVADFPDVPDVVEDGKTFAQNAAKKAVEIATTLQKWAIGEDSGLKVDALKGAPGIFSARYAGEPCDDEANNRKLLEELTHVPPERRSAHYVCHVALADPNGDVKLRVEAYCQGRILDAPRGDSGFGYDPLFLVPEYHRTFGELPPAAKRHISHRARAFEKFIPRLVTILNEPAR